MTAPGDSSYNETLVTVFCQPCKIRFGTTPTNQNQLRGDAAATYEHRIALNSLTASTLFHYSAFNDLDDDGIEDPGENFDTGFFRTVAQSNPAAAQMQPFTFVAFGDTGCVDPADSDCGQNAVRARLENFPSCPDFVIHTGDLIYEYGELGRIDDRYYQPYQNLVLKMPFFLCPGNHDTRIREGNTNRRNYLTSYILPKNSLPDSPPVGHEGKSHRFYSFDYGNIHFVALDTTKEPGEEDNAGNICDEDADDDTPFIDQDQLDFLCQDLASAQRFWKIVFFHHPAFSSVTTNQTVPIKQKLGPIFDKFRVDLAIMGHAHVYERTVPVFNENGDGLQQDCPIPPVQSPLISNNRSPTFGTVYLTTGAGGAPLHNISEVITPSDIFFDTQCATSAFHVTKFTVTRDSMAIEVINRDNVTLETVTMTKAFPPFLRGDVDSSGDIDISDPVIIQNFLFNGTTSPSCLDACDANDSGMVMIDDSTLLLNFIYSGGIPPAPPFPNCGVDPTADVLSCEFHASGFPGCEAVFDTTCPVSCP